MRFLVTGGAGFIGSTLCLELQKEFPDSEIYSVDNFSSGNFKNLSGFSGVFLPLDITNDDFFDLLKSLEFDCIFHLGAITDTTVMDQQLMCKVNSFSFFKMLEILKVKKTSMIYASSASVYGNKPAPNKIADGDSPLNVYAFSKLMMDNYSKIFRLKNPDMKLIGMRFFNVYGPLEKFKRDFASMVYKLCVKMMKNENPSLFKMGGQKRDFVCVYDVVSALISAYKMGSSGIYNIGSGTSATFNEIVDLINKKLNTSLKVDYFDNPYDFYQNHTEADLAGCDKIGYKPKWSLEEGINRLIDELKGKIR